MMALRNWIFLFSALLLTACKLTDVNVSEAKLNTYLQEKVHFEKEIGIPGILSAKVVLNELKSEIGRAEPSKVDVFAAGTISVTSQEKQEELKLSMQVRARPEYKVESGELYLHDLDILSLTTDPAEPGQNLATVLPIISRAIGKFLESHAVYKLEEGNSRKDKILDVQVKPGEIVIPLSLL